HLLRVGWLPGRFREQPLDHLFDLAVQSAMRKAIRRAFLGFQLGPPKQNFVTCETDGNGRFAMQKSEAVSVSDGSFRFILFPSSQHRREGLFSGKRKSFSRYEPLPLLNPSYSGSTPSDRNLFGRKGGMRGRRTTISLGSRPTIAPPVLEMTSEPQDIGSGKELAARLPEVELAVILCRVIESIEHHPAQLRNAVYELARIKLRKEVSRTHPVISLGRLTLALESAIESVETIYSRHDELRALRSLHRLVERSEIGWSEVTIKPREPLLIIDQ